MKTSDIVAMQKKIGVTPDGFWGPKSIEACKAYLRGLMLVPNPWPDTSQAALSAFYGKAGDEDRLTNLNVEDLGLKYDRKAVKAVRCHKKVAASLRSVLESLAKTHPPVLAYYDGCFNNRAMRGGSLPSLHARGAAVDFMSGENGNHTSWPAAATMPLEVMEAFAREGWVAAGAFWGRDAMHFQATL